MIIERRSAYPGKIFVQFESRDFDRYDASGELAWLLAIEEIKSTFKFPSERDFNRQLEAWLIVDTPENMRRLEQIKEKHFVDKNQIRMEFPSKRKE